MSSTPTLLASRVLGYPRGTVGMTKCKAQPRQVGIWKKWLPTIAEVDCEESDEVRTRTAVVISAHYQTSTSTSSPRPPGLPESLTDPSSLAHNVSDAVAVVQRLKDGCKTDRNELLAWLLKALPALALTEAGGKVVQAALEVATGAKRTALTNEFHGSVLKLCMSPHGHQVLANLVQSMPVTAIGFVACEMTGQSVEMARHRFGCCVLEAMAMHCSEAQMAEVSAEIMEEAAELSRHPHGSSVIKHLLEYGNSECRAGIVQRLIPRIPLLAMHRTASHVVEKAFNCCSDEEQYSIAMALLRATAPISVVDVACSRCGSSILEEVASTNAFNTEFRSRLAAALPRLGQSKFGRRVVASFELMLPMNAEVASRGNCTHSAAVAA